jgi:hypothetical protein
MQGSEEDQAQAAAAAKNHVLFASFTRSRKYDIIRECLHEWNLRDNVDAAKTEMEEFKVQHADKLQAHWYDDLDAYVDGVKQTIAELERAVNLDIV